MKDTLVCGNCLSPTLVVNEEGDSHLGLELARTSMKLIEDRTCSGMFYTLILYLHIFKL